MPLGDSREGERGGLKPGDLSTPRPDSALRREGTRASLLRRRSRTPSLPFWVHENGVFACAMLAWDERPSVLLSFSPASPVRAKRKRLTELGAPRYVTPLAWKAGSRPHASSP